jgi:hypothetical protein
MENEHSEKLDNEISPTETDWETRTLCSDGNCIGVIGSDGRCKECGKPFDGPVIEGRTFETDLPEEEDEIVEEEEASDDLEWGDRQLCSDGNCIGVIGADGRCKECGKPYEG